MYRGVQIDRDNKILDMEQKMLQQMSQHVEPEPARAMSSKQKLPAALSPEAAALELEALQKQGLL